MSANSRWDLIRREKVNASFSFKQLLLTPYNFSWTAQLGQAL
jgi:hypothetical protein